MVNKKRIEKYIPRAIEYIEYEFKDYIAKNQGLPKELHGYITSFGASIIQSGLVPAVAFYERSETKNNNDIAINRRKLMKIIGNLIGYDLKSKEEKKDKVDDLLLEKLIIGDEAKKKKNDIIHSAIAIKLAIRLYQQIDKKENKGDS